MCCSLRLLTLIKCLICGYPKIYWAAKIPLRHSITVSECRVLIGPCISFNMRGRKRREKLGIYSRTCVSMITTTAEWNSQIPTALFFRSVQTDRKKTKDLTTTIFRFTMSPNSCINNLQKCIPLIAKTKEESYRTHKHTHTIKMIGFVLFIIAFLIREKHWQLMMPYHNKASVVRPGCTGVFAQTTDLAQTSAHVLPLSSTGAERGRQLL